VPLKVHLETMKITAPFIVARLLKEQDWAPFVAKYRPGGRPGFHPRVMTGLYVYGAMTGIDTLRGLEKLARTDLAAMWITGGVCPDHSVIGRFLLQHSDALTGPFFNGLVGSVLKATGSGVGALAGDGTIVQAAAARVGVMRIEALGAARAKAEAAVAAAPENTAQLASAVARVETLKTAETRLAARMEARQDKGRDAKGLSIHPAEPEAVVQQQKEKTLFAPSYKPFVLANEKRVVTGATVHPSGETVCLDGALADSAAHGAIDTLLVDAGFHSAAVIDIAARRNIDLYCPEGRLAGCEPAVATDDAETRQAGQGAATSLGAASPAAPHAAQPGAADGAKQSDKMFLKNQFAYDAASDSYRCPAGQTLTRLREVAAYASGLPHTLYGKAPCSDCPLLGACTKDRNGRHIKRYASDPAKETLRAKLATPEGRAQYKKRAGMVEPVFAQIKVVQGLRRFRRRGLAKVRLEFMLHVAAYNLSRAVAVAAALLASVWRLLAPFLSRLRQHADRFIPPPALSHAPPIAFQSAGRWTRDSRLGFNNGL
jgi:hypothetical protein